MPHRAALSLSGAFTVAAWVRPESLPASGYPGILRKGRSWVSDGSGGWLLFYRPDTRELFFKRQGVVSRAPGWMLGPVGTWSQVTVTYDGVSANTLRFYLNGSLIGSAAGPAGGYVPLVSTDPLQIGRGDDTSADHSVDEVALYSSALSSGTVANQYQLAIGSGGVPTPPASLTVTAADEALSLKWGASADSDLAGYRVYRRNADGTWPSTPLATTSSTSYTDRGLSNGVAYTYRVTAYDSAGHESAPSGQATGIPTLLMPPNFQEVTLASGLTKPMAVAWAPDGRMFIAHKDGRLSVVDSDGRLRSTPILDIRDEVNAAGDRGLTGIAVDKDFGTNGYLYLLYDYELYPSTPDSLQPVVARVTRIAINPDDTIQNPASPETVLVGTASGGPCAAPANDNDCIPVDNDSHTVGTIRVDQVDGTLWIGNGDASNYNVTDPLSLRAYNEQSFAGKIIHTDRTGHGLANHPFCPADTDLTHVCTKIYAKGFRNPFRFSLRPGAGPIVGDVGWSTQEEIDFVQAGGNYGWPCYEGAQHTPTWSGDSHCPSEYAKEGTSAADQMPVYSYTHASVGGGGCVIGGPLYTGSTYPSGYAGSVFFADYVHGFVKRLLIDGSGNVVDTAIFIPSGLTSIDLEQAPDGNIVTVDPGGFAAGKGAIREWIYVNGNRPPVPILTAAPSSGLSPLAVSFDAGESSDPDGDALTYSWDFGDGSPTSAGITASHTYTTAGLYTAALTVDDGHGHTATTTVTISVGNNKAPNVTVASPADGSLYNDGAAILLQGSAVDPEDGTLPSSALTWHVILNHASHIHDLGTFTGSSATFTALTDHDADSYYTITLTARDSGGLSTSKTISIRPRTVRLNLTSNIVGAPLSYSGTAFSAPRTLTAAVGYVASISAAATFTGGDGKTYVFDHWSDGGAALHTITIPSADRTLTATYKRRPRP